MKSIPGKCQICGTGLLLKIADDYPGGDPMKLVSMATCNRCYDLRDRRIKIEGNIKRICHRLSLGKLDDGEKGRLLEMLKVLARKFSIWCADMLRRQHAANVGYLETVLIDHPEHWYRSLLDFEEAAAQLVERGVG